MKGIKKGNPMLDLSKFASNKKQIVMQVFCVFEVQDSSLDNSREHKLMQSRNLAQQLVNWLRLDQ